MKKQKMCLWKKVAIGVAGVLLLCGLPSCIKGFSAGFKVGYYEDDIKNFCYSAGYRSHIPCMCVFSATMYAGDSNQKDRMIFSIKNKNYEGFLMTAMELRNSSQEFREYQDACLLSNK